jgi:ataxia telangiectasia mutated family protein
MSSVSGLKAALRLYESDKVKERAQGGELIREIFSNKENLLAFQETASRDGGAGWVAFFQCLFQVVVSEKKVVLKANSTAQGKWIIGYQP